MVEGPGAAAAQPTLATVAGLAVTAGGIASAGAASAASKLTVKYKVTGSTFLKSINTTTSLGPGTLKSTVNLSNGKLTASLALPPATVSFKELGLIPVTATTEFVQDGPTTGQLNVNTGAVSTTSKIILKLTSMIVAGLLGSGAELVPERPGHHQAGQPQGLQRGQRRQPGRDLHHPEVLRLRRAHPGAEPDHPRLGQHHRAQARQGQASLTPAGARRARGMPGLARARIAGQLLSRSARYARRNPT